MKAVYIRISTPNQKIERQLKSDKTIKPYIDTCSGSVPFAKRSAGRKLMKAKNITCIEVKEVTRLGRNLNDILSTVDYFTDKGIDIRIENLGLNLIVDGKKSIYGEMILQVLGSISQLEKGIIRERTTEGIAIAKAKGKYKGRKRGTTNKITADKEILITAIQSKLDAGVSISDIAILYNTSRNRIHTYLNKGLLTRDVALTRKGKKEKEEQQDLGNVMAHLEKLDKLRK